MRDLRDEELEFVYGAGGAARRRRRRRGRRGSNSASRNPSRNVASRSGASRS